MIHGTITKIAARVRRAPRFVKAAAAAVPLAILVAFSVPTLFVSQESVFARISGFEDNYAALQESRHADARCTDCHVDERGPVVFAVALAVDYYRSFFVEVADSSLVRIERPKREACLRCHEHDWAFNAERRLAIPHPAHLRVSEETRECVDCHKWTAHMEYQLEAHARMPLSGVCAASGCHAGWRSSDSCADCHHVLLEQPVAWTKEHPQVVLASGAGGCLELCHDAPQCRQCHTTGESPFTGELARTVRSELETLHTRSDWVVQHGLRALDDQNECRSCHISTGECQNCHSQRPASHGPEDMWIAAHPDAVTRDDQCVTCHDQQTCDYCHDLFKEGR